MKNKIISLKWKIVFPLACLFFLMAFAVVYLTSSMTGKAMFDLSEQQANNVLYLVDLNVNDMYKNLLSSKINTILETKRLLQFMNQDIAQIINHNDNISQFTPLLSKYDLITDYNIFTVILRNLNFWYTSNKNFNYDQIISLYDLKGRCLKDILINVSRSKHGEFVIFDFHGRMIVGYLKSYYGQYVIATFVDNEEVRKEIENQKQEMITIIQNSMKKIRIAHTGYLFILDSRNHQTIFPVNDSQKSGNNFDKYIKPEILKYIDAQTSYDPHHLCSQINQVEYYISTVYFRPLKWYIGAVIPVQEIFAPGHRIIKFQSVIVLSVFTASLLLVVVLITRAINPLKKLTYFTSQLSEHDFLKGGLDVYSTFKDDIKRRDEIGILTASFLEMHSALVENVQALVKMTAEQERLESELRIAREIQMGILPPSEPHPSLSHMDFYAYLKPAREVGGDLFHYFFIDDDHICFAVGDVSDKGVPAAFFMAMTMTLLKNTAMSGGKIGDIITRINNELCQNNPNNMFVTLFAGILDIKTGYLEYANAGHNPTIYVPASGSLQLLKNISGPVVGAMEELEYQTFSLQLAPTDLLFLYTDGVTEGMNPDKELYGEKRLMQIITLNAHRLLSHELIQVVCDDLKQFVDLAEQSDDITMMVLRWHGRS